MWTVERRQPEQTRYLGAYKLPSPTAISLAFSFLRLHQEKGELRFADFLYNVARCDNSCSSGQQNFMCMCVSN